MDDVGAARADDEPGGDREDRGDGRGWDYCGFITTFGSLAVFGHLGTLL